PLWTTDVTNNRKAMDITNPHEHIKFVEIISWPNMVDFVTRNLLNTSYPYILLLHLRKLRLILGWPGPSAKTALSLVEGQLVTILPLGVELHIL
ncbi:hypothetical protein Tco_1518693, partial [Tanacetum coccineum]